MNDSAYEEQALTAPKRRGIQLGQNISSGAPRKLESVLTEAHKQIWPETPTLLQEILLPNWRVTHRKKFSGKELVTLLKRRALDLPEDFRLSGYQPDGGIYSMIDPNGEEFPFLTSEAKHQGKDGNAIERWHKNYTITRMLGADVAMLTFATGDGVLPNGPIRTTLNVALAEYAITHRRPIRAWNMLYDQGPSMFCEKDGFTVEHAASILRQSIIRSAESFFRN